MKVFVVQDKPLGTDKGRKLCQKLLTAQYHHGSGEHNFVCVALHENSPCDALGSLLQITVLLVRFALDYHYTQKPLDIIQASNLAINGK